MTKWIAAIALSALALAGCKDAPKEEAEAPARPAATAQTCADDGPRLPLTGLCEGRAVNYLNMDASASPEASEGCEWKVMETEMPDGVLLYHGLKCDAGETKLEFEGGAGSGELKLVRSAYLGKIDEPPTYVHVYTVDGDARQGVTARARAAMESPAEATGCSARAAELEGWPSDALVVDVSAQEAAKAPDDEPRAACGPLGLNQDEMSFWRVVQGYGWFFQLGQDAVEIDPGSFTLMTKQPDGSWGAV